MNNKSKLETLEQDGNTYISGPSHFEQLIKQGQSRKDFSDWPSLEGLAGCLGVSEKDLVVFFRTKLKYPARLLPKKYHIGRI